MARSVSLLPASLLALGLGIAGPAAQAQSLTFPESGVVCDPGGFQGTPACYDAQGLSLGLTRRMYGAWAEARLLENLQGRPVPTEFRLSDGAVCDVRRRLCWDDGWSRTNVSNRLTGRLFGDTASQPVFGGGAQVRRDTGLCSLSRRGQSVYDGPCDLRQVRGNRTRYRVRLGNGATYTFSASGWSNGFSISDERGGTWPVTFVDHGLTGIFRWGEMTLVATQRTALGGGAQPYGYGATSGSEEAGRALGVLLQQLFR